MTENLAYGPSQRPALQPPPQVSVAALPACSYSLLFSLIIEIIIELQDAGQSDPEALYEYA